MEPIRLSRAYPARDGVPVIEGLDPAILVRRYFGACTQCDFCHDHCCSYGVDVDAPNVARILEHAAALERRTGVPRARWFRPGWEADAEFPGGRFTRIRAEAGRCVFLNRAGRGCHLHAHSLETGLDYHRLKPLVSSLLPVTFDSGLLHPSDEVEDRDLVCLDRGPTLYRGVRDELAYYFGPELVAEIDRIEGQVG
jgi:hypothetical protein